uniref:Uncharacterized protein n=1 Tax=Chromera velia CCMP2878 TaxID=1169474 RepID=A0A0G4FI37_9ALVE|eukprot:Cvel_17098.t1-p1 / transcript=Cvel_17098.t1 / gene=Cvel_17098 / organism=Chromera_velia_CCMP2878 / gene_product=hypothetical protein / transcript_product=hypothetical protein / location=Cvel_scaffold1348:23592-24023(-) / protein_length=144 / sequence_SO=supercontig / SO=protein_coding / is_pseudo=false
MIGRVAGRGSERLPCCGAVGAGGMGISSTNGGAFGFSLRGDETEAALDWSEEEEEMSSSFETRKISVGECKARAAFNCAEGGEETPVAFSLAEGGEEALVAFSCTAGEEEAPAVCGCAEGGDKIPAAYNCAEGGKETPAACDYA